MVNPHLSQSHSPRRIRTDWYVYAKNGRINSEERRIGLLAELSRISWTFICFSETRQLSEDVILHGGHRLISSLDEVSANGVAILIHQDYVKRVINSVAPSNRVMAIDVKIGTKVVRVISVYMPHAGYPWQDFVNEFDTLEQLVI